MAKSATAENQQDLLITSSVRKKRKVDAQENSGDTCGKQPCHEGANKVVRTSVMSKRALENAAGGPPCPPLQTTSKVAVGHLTPSAGEIPSVTGDHLGTGNQDSPMRPPGVSYCHKGEDTQPWRAPTPAVLDPPAEPDLGYVSTRSRTRSPTPGHRPHGRQAQGNAVTSKEQLEEDLFSPTRGRSSLERDGTPRMREHSRTPTRHGEGLHGGNPSSGIAHAAAEPYARQRKPLAAVPVPGLGHDPSSGRAQRIPHGPPKRVEGTGGSVPAARIGAGRQHGSMSAASGSVSDGESDTVIDEQTLSVPSRSVGDVEVESEGSEDGDGRPVQADEVELEYIDFDPYSFIKSLPPLEQVVPQWRKTLLPRQTRRNRRKTLVLDLDETLVHSTLDSEDVPDFTFPVNFNNREHVVSVKQRPHLHTFLERVADLFEVVVFTASQKIYAEQLLNILDPERRLIRHRVFRDSCVLVDGNYLKDLTVLGRELAHTVIVDNSPQAFGFQLENGIPIESWYDDDEDAELLRLLPFLESLVNVDDVRPLVKETYKLHHRVQQAPDPPPVSFCGVGGA
eukprot:jgi/Botrbrau1/1578/Bobra.0185s0002.1